MTAAASRYAALNAGVSVRLHTRPLADFNDQPAWEVEPGYDLIFIDHPMTGAVAAKSVLVPLDEVLDHHELNRFSGEAIGDSHRSYTWDGHQWALAVDAASQVAAVHDERLRDLGHGVPRTWDDVLSLAAVRGAVALPLYPSDALCTLVSLSANAAHAAGNEPTWLRPEAVEMLAELARRVDPACFNLNPPRLLALMRAADSTPAYVPFVFGYATLAQPPLSFADVPGLDGEPRGAILGGAGLAIFPSSPHVTEAAAFAAWYMGGQTQRDIVLPSGGQPGSRVAWDASEAFFRDTRRSIEHAYLRPRDSWWPPFQREAGERLVEMLRDGTSPARMYRELVSMADRHREEPAS